MSFGQILRRRIQVPTTMRAVFSNPGEQIHTEVTMRVSGGGFWVGTVCVGGSDSNRQGGFYLRLIVCPANESINFSFDSTLQWIRLRVRQFGV
jgi:hypothetical protein